MESSWGRSQRLRISTKSALIGLGLASVTSLGTFMAVTNPSQAAYESYATQKVVNLLDRNVCAEAPKSFDLRKDCKSYLTANRSQIKEFIANNTQRQNFILFSVYTTDVSVASFLPDYRVESVGAFQQFHVYETIADGNELF
ncbi:MAG: DUF4359 domain-containing protein [Leptolyngbyaceae cyanobacterium bins.302]|nr:DUF4359 domain-containing protein [Leptolyngbyaceae cyanobacterium bins.302]